MNASISSCRGCEKQHRYGAGQPLGEGMRFAIAAFEHVCQELTQSQYQQIGQQIGNAQVKIKHYLPVEKG
jgi:hypothetical protein